MEKTREAEFVAEREEDIIDLGDAIAETEGTNNFPGEQEDTQNPE